MLWEHKPYAEPGLKKKKDANDAALVPKNKINKGLLNTAQRCSERATSEGGGELAEKR